MASISAPKVCQGFRTQGLFHPFTNQLHDHLLSVYTYLVTSNPHDACLVSSREGKTQTPRHTREKCAFNTPQVPPRGPGVRVQTLQKAACLGPRALYGVRAGALGLWSDCCNFTLAVALFLKSSQEKNERRRIPRAKAIGSKTAIAPVAHENHAEISVL